MNIGLEKYRYYFEVLRVSDLFADLPDQAINQFLEYSTCQNWPRKTCILDTQSPYYKCYFVLSGKVKAYCYDGNKDRQLTLFLLQKYDLFDVFSLYSHSPCHIYYESLTEANVLAVPLEYMKKWLQDYPDFTRTLIPYLLCKIKSLQEYLVGLAMFDTPTRLAHLLMRNMNEDSMQIEKINDLSHMELAAMIGTTRAVFNRHLQEFKELGVIRTENRQMRVTNVDWLRAKAANSDQ